MPGIASRHRPAAPLLVARAGGYADLGLTTAVAAGSISFNHTAATWASANDVMGGKPLLVVNGAPIDKRYWALDDEQWEGQVTRLAIGRTEDGRGVMAIMGTSSGSGQGVTAAEFAQSLVQIGVSDALGLNVAHPPELFTPRITSTSCSPLSGLVLAGPAGGIPRPHGQRTHLHTLTPHLAAGRKRHSVRVACMEWQVPTLADVYEARLRIAPHLRPTPLYGYPALDELLGTEVLVKHENHQPIGAFKVRGGVNLVAQLTGGERERGVVTASTGNHGQSIAYAARLFGVRATICVPEAANPVKVASIRGLGAELCSTAATSTTRASMPSTSRSSTAIATSTPATSRR